MPIFVNYFKELYKKDNIEVCKEDQYFFIIDILVPFVSKKVFSLQMRLRQTFLLAISFILYKIL